MVKEEAKWESLGPTNMRDSFMHYSPMQPCWPIIASPQACTAGEFLSGPFPKATITLYFPTPREHFGRNYVVRKLIPVFGYECNITGHSFRLGAATSARLAGLSEEKYWEDGSQIAIGSSYVETHPG